MRNADGWFARCSLERTAPIRTAGTYYRSAGTGANTIAGIPLNSAEAAVVAAVRTAYKVAETQIDRSARLARRLRDAGDRAVGPGSDQQALDATEGLLFRAAMALLGWVEGATASDSGNPLRRLATAQYQLLGSTLGLRSSEASSARTTQLRGQASEDTDTGSVEHAPLRAQPSPRFPVKVKHTGKERRVVRVAVWEYAGDARSQKTIPVTFYHRERGFSTPLKGQVAVGQKAVTLTLATTRSAPAGRWRAALCDASDVQVGRIEIIL